MDELNFCPLCSAQGHKVVSLKGRLRFCKSCDKFFTFREEELKCPRCGSKRIEDSDFPSPSGDLVFHCMSCKKMYPAREFFDRIEKSMKN